MEVLTLLLTPGLVYLQVRMEKMCEKAQKTLKNLVPLRHLCYTAICKIGLKTRCFRTESETFSL